MSEEIERGDVKALLKSAAWTVCLLAEVLKEDEIDWSAASELARALEAEAMDLKSLAWTGILSRQPPLDLQ